MSIPTYGLVVMTAPLAFVVVVRLGIGRVAIAMMSMGGVFTAQHITMFRRWQRLGSIMMVHSITRLDVTDH